MSHDDVVEDTAWTNQHQQYHQLGNVNNKGLTGQKFSNMTSKFCFLGGIYHCCWMGAVPSLVYLSNPLFLSHLQYLFSCLNYNRNYFVLKFEISNIDLAKLIIKIFDKKNLNPIGFSDKLIQFVNDRAGHDFRYSIDHNKITKELGWRPKTNFYDGVNETIKWYLKNL